jgi:hypothetical protein
VKIWFAILFLWSGTVAFSQDATSVTLDRLANIKVFAFGRVGFVGVISKGELDFWVIMSLPQKDALADLEELYVKGNPQAKSYALAGIRKLDKKRFNELLSSAESSDLQVATQRGCIIWRRPLRKIAMALNSGEFDAQLP